MAAMPQRIVSLCVHGDQYLLTMVARERILAVSPFAADPDICPYWKEAQNLPVVADAEGLARLRPDLVLISSYSKLPLYDLLQKRGVPVLKLDVPQNFDSLRTQILQVGEVLGTSEKAEKMVRLMDAKRTALLARRPSHGPTALFYYQDGFTPGAESFAHVILETAGFRDLGPALHRFNFLSTPLERVLMARPQWIILTRYRPHSPVTTQSLPSSASFEKAGMKVMELYFRELAAMDSSELALVETLQTRLLAP